MRVYKFTREELARYMLELAAENNLFEASEYAKGRRDAYRSAANRILDKVSGKVEVE